MKKMLLILLAGALVLMAGCEGPAGPAGVDGISGNAVPGGTLEINISEGLTENSKIVLVFDPDATLLDGNETVYDFPLADHTIIDNATLYTTWYAPEVVPGDYYVYYWIDFDGNGQIATSDENGAEEYTLDIFGSKSRFSFSPPGAVTSIKSNGAILLPNYTVWEDYAPPLNLVIVFSGY